MGMDVYYCSQYWENTDWVYFINQDYHFLGGRNVIEIVLDGEQIIKEAHSVVVEKLCTFSSDSEHEKIFSTYLRQKKCQEFCWWTNLRGTFLQFHMV